MSAKDDSVSFLFTTKSKKASTFSKFHMDKSLNLRSNRSKINSNKLESTPKSDIRFMNIKLIETYK